MEPVLVSDTTSVLQEEQPVEEGHNKNSSSSKVTLDTDRPSVHHTTCKGIKILS